MNSLYLHPKQHEVFSDKTRFKVVAAGRRWGKCLRKGTIVKTSGGIDVKIENLKVGDSILSMNPNTLLLENKVVTEIASNGKRELLKISTAFRTISCTPNHPLMIDWGWVEAKDIKPKDLIGVTKKGAFSDNISKETALKPRESRDSYLPISHDEFMNHLKYSPKSPNSNHIAEFDAKATRDFPNELELFLNNWREQTPERISCYEFMSIKECSDGYFDKAINGDIAWEEVISVEHDGYDETYDIEVEDNHNFVANGIISHNSRLSQVSLIYKATEKTGSNVWYIAPSYRMAKQIMWDEINRMIPDKWIKKRNETFMRIDLLNNSIIELKGADAPDSLRGVGLNYVVLDEMQDMRAEVWKSVVRPTLATTRGEALFIGTSKGMNHFHDIWAKGMSGTSPHWKSWQFTTESSPFVSRDEIEQAKRDMDAKTYRQEFLSSFEEMSGRVYHSFDKRIHVGQYKFNPNLPICIGQDFNIDPMSSIIFQQQSNGDVWAVDEIVLFSSNTQEVCEEIERRYWRHTKQITIYPDPAGGARQHARGETDLDIFREKGFSRIKYHRKHPRVADRVNSVNKMLLSADGTIRLRIDEKCKYLIDSFERTMYKEGGREVDKSMGTDHYVDAAGYYIQYEFPARKVEVSGISI